MSFNRERGLFNVAPGFHSPKREPGIIKALQKLHKKIQHLEQVRISEKQAISAEVQTGLDDGDLTVTDIQYQLLLLQLKYVRSILKKKAADQQNSTSPKEIYKSKNLCEGTILSTDTNLENVSSESNKNNQHKETQIGSSFTEALLQDAVGSNSRPRDVENSANNIKVAAAVQTFDEIENTTDFRSEGSKPVSTNVKLNSQPHYHLKLSHVPFILGASTSASHSVVANVQNIIAMMKSHNKALCGPKLSAQCNLVSAANKKEKEDTTDTSKMLKSLSEGLSELSQKQGRMDERLKMFESAQKKGQFGSNTELGCSQKVFKNSIVKGITNAGTNYPQQPSKVVAKVQEEKLIVPNVRVQTNISQPARRRFLHCLQDFKTHLSEEDISWN